MTNVPHPSAILRLLGFAVAAGLAMGRTTPGVRRHQALIVLILMAANYGMRAVAHHEALALAPRLFGPTLPQRCAPSVPTARIIDRWPRSAPPAWTAPAGHRCLVEIAAIPTFLSPFRWRVLAQMSNAYEIRDMNVLDPRLRDPASDVSWRVRVRYPNLWTPGVKYGVQPGSFTHLTELFGPVLGVMRFRKLSEAVARSTGKPSINSMLRKGRPAHSPVS